MGGCLSKKSGEGGDSAPKEAADKTEETQKTEETPKTEENGTAETVEQTTAQDTPAEATGEADESGEKEKPIVFVLGASGMIGSATCKSLSEKFGDVVQIRAGVRNPDGAEKLKELSNVTVVQASMADKDGLISTLAGVSALYIVVPGSENRAELAELSIEAAKEAGVKHVVVVSVPTVGKADILFSRQFKVIEDKVSSIGLPYTIIRIPYFLDNLLGSASSVKDNGKFSLPLSGDKPMVIVATSDAGLAAATVLSDPSKHEGKTYEIVSGRVTMDEVATALGSVLEKEVSYEKMEMDEAKQVFLGFGMPEWQVDGLLEMFKLMEEESPGIGVDNLGDHQEITGEEPTSAKDFFNTFAAAFQ